MTVPANYRKPPAPTFLFDLDGTLIDTVHQHAIAWRSALSRLDIDLSIWRIHRRIGVSGGLFLSALLRETGRRRRTAPSILPRPAPSAPRLRPARLTDSARFTMGWPSGG